MFTYVYYPEIEGSMERAYLSMTPPESPLRPLLGARESSSSKNTTQGAAVRALENTGTQICGRLNPSPLTPHLNTLLLTLTPYPTPPNTNINNLNPSPLTVILNTLPLTIIPTQSPLTVILNPLPLRLIPLPTQSPQTVILKPLP